VSQLSLIEQGQSCNISDNLGAKSQLLLGKSEEQWLEDIDTDRTNASFSPLFPRRETCSVSPSDDDPLVSQEAEDQIRRERSIGLSHVDERGGDVLKLKPTQQSTNQWLIRDQLRIMQVELPAEARKKELKQELEDS
jgi:hypothetical protein